MRAWVLGLRNRYYLLADIILLPLAACLTVVLRLEPAGMRARWDTAILTYVLLAPALKIPIFALMGGYSRYWPFASLPEAQLIVSAAAIGELACAGVALVLARLIGFDPMPQSIPFIGVFLTAGVLTLPRYLVRQVNARTSRHAAKTEPIRRVLIVGAGEGGNVVLREIHRNPQMGLEVAGIVDDDPTKQGLQIHNVRVLGPIDDIPGLVKQHHIEQVLIAIPTATSAEMRHIVDVCRRAQVEVQTLPGVFELIGGQVQIQRFRPVQVEDLLAREPIKTDTTGVQLLLKGKRVLITGAGGSIGSEICRQVAAGEPAALVLLGHGENSIYKVHRELQAAHPELTLVPVIADTRDAVRIGAIFDRHRPEIVLHAAAHKHVPLMELNPAEAVTNNVGGTKVLVETCERYNVGTFVMISTDKAVNPTSTMGATKRIAEHLVQEAAQRQSARSGSGRFVVVRFGNVLGSRGSVVPLFQQQIEAGGPVTVTHPEMERYFMTIPEAVQLVLQAAALGRGGELFILDMGEPVKIVDLARDMIRLARLEEGHDIEIAFTGLRPGEKLYEELFLTDEHHARTVHEKIFVSRNGHAAECALDETVACLLAAAHAQDRDAVYDCIRQIVPECADTMGEEA